MMEHLKQLRYKKSHKRISTVKVILEIPHNTIMSVKLTKYMQKNLSPFDKLKLIDNGKSYKLTGTMNRWSLYHLLGSLVKGIDNISIKNRVNSIRKKLVKDDLLNTIVFNDLVGVV